MNRSARIAIVGVSFVAAALAAPVSVHAQCAIPSPDGLTMVPVNSSIVGVLTETMESAPAHAAPGGTGPLSAGSYPDGPGVRLAQATERGQLGVGAACGALGSIAGSIVVHAQSRITVVTDDNGQLVLDPISGAPELTTGTIEGHFKVVTATGTVGGSLDGNLDFTLTLPTATACSGGPCPWALANGTWSTTSGGGVQGGFSGFALIPFQLPLPDGTFTPWMYFDPTGALTPDGNPGTVPLNPTTDMNGTSPAAKFIVTLYQ